MSPTDEQVREALDRTITFTQTDHPEVACVLTVAKLATKLPAGRVPEDMAMVVIIATLAYQAGRNDAPTG